MSGTTRGIGHGNRIGEKLQLQKGMTGRIATVHRVPMIRNQGIARVLAHRIRVVARDLTQVGVQVLTRG